jgi:hypothetical protein
MAPTSGLTLGRLGGLGDVIGGYPEAEQTTCTVDRITSMPSTSSAVSVNKAAGCFHPALGVAYRPIHRFSQAVTLLGHCCVFVLSPGLAAVRLKTSLGRAVGPTPPKVTGPV